MSDGSSIETPLTLGASLAGTSAPEGAMAGSSNAAAAGGTDESFLKPRGLTPSARGGTKPRRAKGGAGSGGGFWSGFWRLVLGLILGILVAVMAAAAFLYWRYPPETVQADLEHKLSQALHRPVMIAGGLGLSVHPALGVEARSITVRGLKDSKVPNLLFVQRLVLVPDLDRLMSGQLVFKDVLLDHPTLTLETTAEGHSNFDFPKEPAIQDGSATASGLRFAGVDRFEIREGLVIWTETGGQGRGLKVEKISARLRAQGVDQPVQIEGQALFKGEPVVGQMELGTPHQIMAHEPFALGLAVRSTPLALRFVGRVDPVAETLSGQFAARGGSLRGAAAWVGKPLPPGKGLGLFQVAGQVQSSPKHLDLTALTLSLDALRGTGDLKVLLDGPRPEVSGALNLVELDLTPYLPEANRPSGRGLETSAPWSTQAFSLGALDGLKVDLDLNTDRGRFRKIETGPARLHLALTPGMADLDLKRVELYGGVMVGKIHLAREGQALRAVPSLALADVDMGPFLRDAVGFEKLSGRGALRLALSGGGRNQDELMHSWFGRAEVKMGQGGISGLDLMGISSQIRSGVSTNAYGPLARTRFVDLGASFEVRQGVAVTKDFSATLDKIRVLGAGQVDLGGQSLDLNINVFTQPTKAAKSLPWGGGVPFRMHGPWGRLKFEVNLLGEVKAEVQRGLESLSQGAKSLGDQVSGFFKGQLGARGHDAPEAKTRRP